MSPAALVAAARSEAEACPWSHDLKTSCPLGYTGYILPHGDKGHVNAHLAAAVATDRERVAREAGRQAWDDAVRAALRMDTVATGLWPGEAAVVKRLVDGGGA